MNRFWTEEETAYVRAWYRVRSVRAIANHLGRSEKAVTMHAFGLGLCQRKRRHPSKDEYVAVADRFAREAGISRVKMLAGDMRPTYVHTRWRAWKHLRESGHTLTGIATVSGFDHSTVHNAFKMLARA